MCPRAKPPPLFRHRAVVFQEIAEQIDFGDDVEEGIAVGKDGGLAGAGYDVEDTGFLCLAHRLGVFFAQIGQRYAIPRQIQRDGVI